MSTVRFLQHRLLSGPPYVLRWHDDDNPLPLRKIHSPSPRQKLHYLQVAPPWLKTGRHDTAFDFTAAVRHVCEDIVLKCSELRHIDPARLLFAVTQARNATAHGLQARVTPLRFPGGELLSQRRGVLYQVQRYFRGKREFLYLVTFCLPRYLNQDFDGKLITLFHELYHISPRFEGDLRRYKGRYSVHSHSQKKYDEKMAELAREYLSNRPDAGRLDFLRLSFSQLEHRHGSVVGVVVPRPKIVPIFPKRRIG